MTSCKSVGRTGVLNMMSKLGEQKQHEHSDIAEILRSISSNITNKMQRYTIFFITVNALHVSGGFSAHHQELKNCTHSIWYMSSLLAANVSIASLPISVPYVSRKKKALYYRGTDHI
jgi:hypothetical protein